MSEKKALVTPVIKKREAKGKDGKREPKNKKSKASKLAIAAKSNTIFMFTYWYRKKWYRGMTAGFGSLTVPLSTKEMSVNVQAVVISKILELHKEYKQVVITNWKYYGKQK